MNARLCEKYDNVIPFLTATISNNSFGLKILIYTQNVISRCATAIFHLITLETIYNEYSKIQIELGSLNEWRNIIIILHLHSIRFRASPFYFYLRTVSHFIVVIYI